MLDIEQGSPEWFAARCGRVTASRVADIIAKTKSGPSASRANYLAELVAERLTGTTAPAFTNDAMRWGTEQEPAARLAYEFREEVEVVQVGFVIHPRIEMAGASPDGLVCDDGLVEIKCPNTATHIDTLLGQAVPAKYATQMQWQMACTGRQWCDFVSFDPRLPVDMQMFIRRVNRDADLIADLEAEVEAFLRELDDKVARLRGLYSTAEAA
jgi:putative phage-type endonuclease